jgi:hypothetical protein
MTESKAAKSGKMTCRPTVLTFLRDEEPRDRDEVRNHVLSRGFKLGTYYSTITFLLGNDPRPNRQIDHPHVSSAAGGKLSITKTGLKWLAEREGQAGE